MTNTLARLLDKNPFMLMYVSFFSDVLGLVTEGSTPQEIAYNVQEALEALMAAWQELGKQPPLALRNEN